MRRDLGDFQTPPALVAEVLAVLSRGAREPWVRALEPTCGIGNFIEGLQRLAIPPVEIQAFEIQSEHARQARSRTQSHCEGQVSIQCADIFQLDFHKLYWKATGPLLVLGNPPWVTNSALGVLGSKNLPVKSNFKGHRGIEARTGAANFDIAEFIWLKLLNELQGESATVAMLCKTSVARNVLAFAAKEQLPFVRSAVYRLDAKRWFDAAVDACLFEVQLGPPPHRYEAPIFAALDGREPIAEMGVVNGRLVADLASHRRLSSADGRCSLTWRQGIKHDTAPIVELAVDGDDLRNGFGEAVVVEPAHVYPLLKCTDLFRQEFPRPRRAVLVPQHRLGEDTNDLATTAPLLWAYLEQHRAYFDKRKSSIYLGRSPYAVFGVGEYTFAPYKVAVSGLHKMPKFRAVAPVGGRPVLFDDTCYFLPCASAPQAAFLTAILDQPACLELVHSLLFTDAKRPITKKLLQRLDLLELLRFIDRRRLVERAEAELARLSSTRTHDRPWDRMEDFLLSGNAEAESPLRGTLFP